MRGRGGGVCLLAGILLAACAEGGTPAFAHEAEVKPAAARSAPPAVSESLVLNRADTVSYRFLVVEAGAAIVAVRGDSFAVERADSLSLVVPLASVALERTRSTASYATRNRPDAVYRWRSDTGSAHAVSARLTRPLLT